MKKLACVFASAMTVCVLSINAFGDQFKDGVAAFDKKDYAMAMKELEPLAEKGDHKAQLGVGFMYYRGLGVPKNGAEALKWFTRSARQGNSEAQYNAGALYLNGEGAAADPKEAYKWFYLATKGEDKDAPGKIKEIMDKNLLSKEQMEDIRNSLVNWKPDGK